MQDKFLKNATNRQPEVLEKRMEMSLKITSIHIMSQLGFEDTCSILLNHLGWFTHLLFELLQPKTKKSFFFFFFLAGAPELFLGIFYGKKDKISYFGSRNVNSWPIPQRISLACAPQAQDYINTALNDRTHTSPFSRPYRLISPMGFEKNTFFWALSGPREINIDLIGTYAQ